MTVASTVVHPKAHGSDVVFETFGRRVLALVARHVDDDIATVKRMRVANMQIYLIRTRAYRAPH